MSQNYRETASGFSYKPTQRGITGTRTFVYDPETYNKTLGTFNDELPKIGAPFSVNSSVVCRTKTKRYIDEDKRKWEIVCEYSNEPYDSSSFGATSGAIYPTSYQFGGDMQVLYPARNQASSWVTIGGEVKEPIPFRVITMEKNISRVMNNSSYDFFLTKAFSCLGHINGGTVGSFLTLPNTAGGSGTCSSNSPGLDFSSSPGCWLMNSFNAEPFLNYNDEKAWKVEMNFLYRCPQPCQQGTSYGWLKILRTDGKQWDIPYFFDAANNKRFMYPFCSIGFNEVLV